MLFHCTIGRLSHWQSTTNITTEGVPMLACLGSQQVSRALLLIEEDAFLYDPCAPKSSLYQVP